MVSSQFKIPANLAQLAVPKMLCLYANAVVQPSVQHCPCYMAWKSKVHTWCRHCHRCINAPMWREKRWLQGLFDLPSYPNPNTQKSYKILQRLSPKHATRHVVLRNPPTLSIATERLACLNTLPWRAAGDPRLACGRSRVWAPPAGAPCALFSPPSLPSCFRFFSHLPHHTRESLRVITIKNSAGGGTLTFMCCHLQAR